MRPHEREITRRDAPDLDRRRLLLGAACVALAGPASAATGSLFPGSGPRRAPVAAGAIGVALPRAGSLWEREPPQEFGPERGREPRQDQGATSAEARPALEQALARSGRNRRIRLLDPRTGETLDVDYARNGRYDRSALDAISHFARDWRENVAEPVDPVAVDIAHALWASLGVASPMVLLSGFRTARTNRALRGAAPDSLHLRAKALDLTHPDRSVEQLARAATALQAGGVGRYDRSGFIHIDSGQQRTWSG